MGLSLILSDINGCNELIKNNESGLLIPPKSIEAIVTAMKTLYLSRELGDLLGINAFNEIRLKYSQHVVWNQILLEYESLIKQFKNRVK